MNLETDEFDEFQVYVAFLYQNQIHQKKTAMNSQMNLMNL
jgi:hypothetical protein